MTLLTVMTAGNPATAFTKVAIDEPASVAESYVGMEAAYFLRYDGPTLIAKGVVEDEPIILRIAAIAEVEGGKQYELRFIGNTPGYYNLRDYLERVDGGSTEDVESVTVKILGLLPEEHDGAIAEVTQPTVPSPGGYYLLAYIGVAVWIFPLLALLIWWIVSREKPEIEQIVRGPTLADQLRPLVHSAVNGELETDGRARLERLLIQYWRGRLNLGSLSPSDALGRMKEHDDAGALLRQLETWLHARPKPDQQEETARQIADLLRPYEKIKAIDEPSVDNELNRVEAIAT